MSYGVIAKSKDVKIFWDTLDLTSGDNDLFELEFPDGAMASGHLWFHVLASDGTDHQSRGASIAFAVVRKGGTYYLDPSILTTADNTKGGLSTGTLTVQFKLASGTDIAKMVANVSSSLTTTVFRMFYFAFIGTSEKVMPKTKT